MVAYSFNAQQYEPQYGSSGGLPVGKYKGIIEASDPKPTKDGSGNFLALTLKVIEGPQTGGTHVDRLNLFNQNPDTVRIANQQLSAYCHVTGVFQFQDTAQLHGIPFMFEIGPQKNGEYTEVKKLFDVNGNEIGKAGAGPQAQPQQQQGGGMPQGFGAQGGQPQGFGGGQPQGQPQNNGGAAWGNQGGGQPQQQPQDQSGGQWGNNGGQPQGQPQGGFGGNPGGGGGQWAPGGNAGGGAPGWGAR